MNQTEHPLIDWLTENDDVPYNLASSSIPEYELSDGCTIEEGEFLGHDNEIEVELLGSISSFYEEDVHPIITFGAQSANFLTLFTLLDDDSNVIVEDPTYLPIQKIAESTGNEVKLLSRRYDENFKISLDEVKKKFDEDTKAVVMTNPHNPSGLYSEVDELEGLQEFLLEKDAYLVVDEVFRDILDETDPTVSIGENVISTNSLSKVYGMGGLRIGWTVTRNEALAEMMESTQVISLTPASAISEKIAVCEMKHKGKIIERSKDISARGLSIVKEWIEKNENIEWLEPPGGIISFPKLDIGCDVETFSKKARDEGVLVSPGGYFTRTDRFDDHIRLTFGERPEIIKEGLKILNRVIDGCR